MKFSKKKALIALSISLCQAVMSQNLFNPGNKVYAGFQNHTVTSKYCPYEQADHLVDGLWWFYDRTSGNAFFILSRVKENGEIKFINKSSYLEDLKKKHFKVIHINELKENYQTNGENSFDEYLYRSFIDAAETKGNNPYQEYPNLIKDNPLEILKDYFEGYDGADDYHFWRRIFSKSLDEQGPIEKPNTKILNFWKASDRTVHPFFKEFLEQFPNWEKDIKNFNSEEKTKSFVLSHGTPVKDRSELSHLSSYDTIKLIKPDTEGRTTKRDARLKNSGYVFTTLCVSDDWKIKMDTGQYVRTSPTRLFFKNIEKLPFVVISMDQIHEKSPGTDNVYICPGKEVAALFVRRFLEDYIDEEPDYIHKITNKHDFEKRFNTWLNQYGTTYPYECRIPTYLIPQKENFE